MDETLLRLLVIAVTSIEDEVVTVGDFHLPLPDDVIEKLAERDALVETLRSAPAEVRPALIEVYRRERAMGYRGTTEVTCPMDRETLAAARDVRRALRSAANWDDEVRLALRESGSAWWLW